MSGIRSGFINFAPKWPDGVSPRRSAALARIALRVHDADAAAMLSAMKQYTSFQHQHSSHVRRSRFGVRKACLRFAEEACFRLAPSRLDAAAPAAPGPQVRLPYRVAGHSS